MSECHATNNGAVADVDADEVGGDREEGGVIPPLLFPSTKMINCKDNNDKDDNINIYSDGNNGYIPDHEYHVKYRIIAGTVTG